MLDYESRNSKEKNSDLELPEWMSKPGRGALTEQEFHEALNAVIHSGALRALRKTLWPLLKHRFRSVPRLHESYMADENDPERLLAAFKKALTIEKIEDLRI
ncbi:MAG: hypothetical protein ACYC3I_20985 [Gemmataceae bacterium]